jgi:hypothetical protein
MRTIYKLSSLILLVLLLSCNKEEDTINLDNLTTLSVNIVNDAANFTQSFNHTSIVFNDKIWIIAGFDDNSGVGVGKNDVWTFE